MVSATLRDVALLLARLGLGVIFIAHGWQKVRVKGMATTAVGLDQVGVPAPVVATYYATCVELIGGAALIAGLFTVVAATLLFVDMLGAFVFVHATHGVFVDYGGYELVLALGLAALLIAVFGAGRYSIDGLAGGRRRLSD